jgi:plastocyanin
MSASFGRVTGAHIIFRLVPRPFAPSAALAAAPLVCAALALGGCGGDDDGGGGGSTTVDAGATVTVVGKEYSFSPSDITVQGAGKVTIALKNEGSLAHDLHVLKDGDDLGGTPVFQGKGETKSGTVELQPGSYEFVCTVGNHEDLGMRGKLEVKQ